MKREISKKIFVLALSITFVVISMAPAIACKDYKMIGKISAIDMAYNTVVIKVPLAKGKVFTVAGPLAPSAIVKKNGERGSLSDFKVGEKVLVKWQHTDNGHLILALISK